VSSVGTAESSSNHPVPHSAKGLLDTFELYTVTNHAWMLSQNSTAGNFGLHCSRRDVGGRGQRSRSPQQGEPAARRVVEATQAGKARR
jgi:hypothetical protein